MMRLFTQSDNCRFCPIDPLARKSRTKRVSLLPVITSESQSVAGRNAGPGLLGASTPMRGQRTARKSPTLRAHRSTAGGVPVTQSRPIVGRPFGVRCCVPLVRVGDDAPVTGSSAGATRQAEIDQHSQELAMRRMSDTSRLSDTAAKQLAGARQRNRQGN